MATKEIRVGRHENVRQKVIKARSSQEVRAVFQRRRGYYLISTLIQILQENNRY